MKGANIKIVDLDKKGDMWNEILNEYKEVYDKIKPQLKEIVDSMVGKYYYLIYPLIKTYYYTNNVSYKDEINNISKILDFDVYYVIILQLCYEMFSCCSCAITKINEIYTFFRTMDWDMTFLKEITIDIAFMRNKEVIYYATSFVGYVGILTATVPSKYSLAINYRNTGITHMKMLKKFLNIMNLTYPIGYLIRDVCDKSYDYEEMSNILKNTELISSCYITICSTNNNPVVITRDPNDYVAYSSKYMVQTNHDQNKKEPNILYSIERSNKIRKIIENGNNNFNDSREFLTKIFIHPIINEKTIYVSVMCPTLSTHYSIIN